MFASMHRKNSGTPARTRRHVTFVLLTAMLPLGVAVSQSPVVARAALTANDCGTWAMLQVSKTSAMTFYTPSINAALAIPGVKGLSLRAPWTAITSNLTIFDMGVQIAAADHSALAIRFLRKDTAGTVPREQHEDGDLHHSAAVGRGIHAHSFVPNTISRPLQRNRPSAGRILRCPRLRILHLPWYSGATAEIYDGPEVMTAPGYSAANFLTGYERLMAIGLSVAGPISRSNIRSAASERARS